MTIEFIEELRERVKTEADESYFKRLLDDFVGFANEKNIKNNASVFEVVFGFHHLAKKYSVNCPFLLLVVNQKDAIYQSAKAYKEYVSKKLSGEEE